MGLLDSRRTIASLVELHDEVMMTEFGWSSA